MQIIFREDIPGVARKNEMKDLKPGYARSFIASGRAYIATPQTILAIAAQAKKKAAEESLRSDLLEKTIASIDGKKITLREKTNEVGHLYHGIAKEVIMRALQKELHVSFPETILEYEKPIKEKGEFPLALVLSGKKKGEVTVIVESL